MDAQYLKKNVHGALTEALTSMAVALPDDKVDYIGRYLLQYVERKKSIAVAQKELIDTLEGEVIFTKESDAREARKLEEQSQISHELERLPQFIASLKSIATSKESAMSLVCNFAVDFLKIPAAYVAISKNTSEGECLQYVCANKTQEIILGKILRPVADDADEGTDRQGLSFDAFKIPEVDNGDDDFDEDGNPKLKPTPKPRPLVVENTMREKRCKFFGIPMLGAYAGIPLSFDSIDHEIGCLPGSGDQESPAFVANKINQKVLLGIDTIGAYRTFKVSRLEIDI
jgi:hypothetical protein